MRDIRVDLRERLQAIKNQRLALDQEEQSLKALLQLEEQRFATEGALRLTSADRLDLSDAIVGVLRVHKEPMTTNAIRAEMDGSVDFGGKAPGRVLHTTLLAMSKSGQVDKTNEGWQLKEVVQ